MSQTPPSSSAPYLIVGLGNPGSRFAGTRHNAGFMAVDDLARRHGLRFSTRQANAEIARGSINGTGVIFAKPQTYMNNSGQAVGALFRFYKIPLERILIVYDDIALPLGTLRLRGKGSAGGHNGLTSVIQHLGTQNFPRLRIGVDRPVVADHKQIDWVLGHFTREEKQAMEETLSRAADAIEAMLRDGIERAMNTYNTPEEKSEIRNQKSEGVEQDQPQLITQHSELSTSEDWRARLNRIISRKVSGE